MLGVVDLQWLQWLLDIIAPKNASWTLTVFHLTPVIVFAVTAFVAMWRFTIFRMREPAINIELDVTSRPSSPSYNGITAVAILTNPSRVVAKCTTLIWQVRVLAPYTDEDVESKPESTDRRREGWANWDEGAYKGESLGSIGTDVTRQKVFSSGPGPRERSIEAGNRVIVRSDAAGCTRGPGGREFGGVGSVADSAVRLGVGWLAVGPGREWPAQPRASPGEDAK